MRPTTLLMHERLCNRLFPPLADFDVPAFSDWGRPLDNANRWVDGIGVQFLTPKRRTNLGAKRKS